MALHHHCGGPFLSTEEWEAQTHPPPPNTSEEKEAAGCVSGKTAVPMTITHSSTAEGAEPLSLAAFSSSSSSSSSSMWNVKSLPALLGLMEALRSMLEPEGMRPKPLPSLLSSHSSQTSPQTHASSSESSRDREEATEGPGRGMLASREWLRLSAAVQVHVQHNMEHYRFPLLASCTPRPWWAREGGPMGPKEKKKTKKEKKKENKETTTPTTTQPPPPPSPRASSFASSCPSPPPPPPHSPPSSSSHAPNPFQEWPIEILSLWVYPQLFSLAIREEVFQALLRCYRLPSLPHLPGGIPLLPFSFCHSYGGGGGSALSTSPVSSSPPPPIPHTLPCPLAEVPSRTSAPPPASPRRPPLLREHTDSSESGEEEGIDDSKMAPPTTSQSSREDGSLKSKGEASSSMSSSTTSSSAKKKRSESETGSAGGGALTASSSLVILTATSRSSPPPASRPTGHRQPYSCSTFGTLSPTHLPPRSPSTGPTANATPPPTNTSSGNAYANTMMAMMAAAGSSSSSSMNSNSGMGRAPPLSLLRGLFDATIIDPLHCTSPPPPPSSARRTTRRRHSPVVVEEENDIQTPPGEGEEEEAGGRMVDPTASSLLRRPPLSRSGTTASVSGGMRITVPYLSYFPSLAALLLSSFSSPLPRAMRSSPEMRHTTSASSASTSLFSPPVPSSSFFVGKYPGPTTPSSSSSPASPWLPFQGEVPVGCEFLRHKDIRPYTARITVEVPRHPATLLATGAAFLHRYALCALPVDLSFRGEAGVGLGPTLEFLEAFGHALASQDSGLGLWRTEEVAVASAASSTSAPRRTIPTSNTSRRRHAKHNEKEEEEAECVVPRYERRVLPLLFPSPFLLPPPFASSSSLSDADGTRTAEGPLLVPPPPQRVPPECHPSDTSRSTPMTTPTTAAVAIPRTPAARLARRYDVYQRTEERVWWCYILGLYIARLMQMRRTAPFHFHPLFLKAFLEFCGMPPPPVGSGAPFASLFSPSPTATQGARPHVRAVERRGGGLLTHTPEEASMHLGYLDPVLEHSLRQLEQMSEEELRSMDLYFVWSVEDEKEADAEEEEEDKKDVMECSGLEKKKKRAKKAKKTSDSTDPIGIPPQDGPPTHITAPRSPVSSSTSASLHREEKKGEKLDVEPHPHTFHPSSTRDPTPPHPVPRRVQEEVPLVPGGDHLPVGPHNVHAYTFLLRQRHLDEPLRVMLHFFCLGLHTVVHPSYLSLFSVPELDGLWSGGQSLDAAEVWESPEALAASVLPSHGYTWQSETIQWFLEVVGHWPAKYQRLFLKFVTGSSMTMAGSGGGRRRRGAGGGGGGGASNEDSPTHPHPTAPFAFSSSSSSFGAPSASVLLEYPITVVRRDVEESSSSPSPPPPIAEVPSRSSSPPPSLRAASSFPATSTTTTSSSSSLPNRRKNDEDGAKHHEKTERASKIMQEKWEEEEKKEQRRLLALQKNVDASLPSASTCFHYLKLPKYSSREVLEKQLLRAVLDGQGSFDLT